MRKLLLSLCLAMASLASLAQVPEDSTRVLFIGNSYTYTNNLPETIRQIAATQKIRVYCQSCTPGGYTFKRHMEREDELDVIREGNWDFVVLQENSSYPARPTAVVAQETYPYARQLDSIIHACNPEAQVIFYMTWGHKDGNKHMEEDYPLNRNYTGMQERLKTSYLEMTYDNNAWCAPVGMVWQEVRRERPDLILYRPDRSHPSELGSYLAANVIFTTMFQRHYQTGYIGNIDPADAEYIQQKAQKTVFENLYLLNIGEARRYSDGQAIKTMK